MFTQKCCKMYLSPTRKSLKSFCILRYEQAYNLADISAVPGFLWGKSVAVPRTQILTLSSRESVELNGRVPLLWTILDLLITFSNFKIRRQNQTDWRQVSLLFLTYALATSIC